MKLHSFVIRIWQEEERNAESAEKWRGHILHYPSQHEQYFDDLCNIVPFIQSCTAHGGSPHPKAETPAQSSEPESSTPESTDDGSAGNRSEESNGKD